MMDRWIALTAAFDCSGASRGEERGPEAFTTAGLFSALGIDDVRELDARLDSIMRDPNTGIIGYDRVVEISRAIHGATTAVYEEGARPLLVGGDCGCIIGALAAARDRHGRLGACVLDAHLDSYDGATSPTGELADMDIAIVTGRGDAALVNLGGQGPICRPGDAIVVGYRVPDGGELQGSEPEHLVADPRIQVIWAEGVLRHGAGEVAAYAAERLVDQAGAFWLHFDVDCFDRRVMPAMSYGQDFGLAYEHVEELLTSLLASDGLVGVSISDFAAPKDPNGSHARRLVRTVATAWQQGLGRRR
jgi:arginase